LSWNQLVAVLPESESPAHLQERLDKERLRHRQQKGVQFHVLAELWWMRGDDL
jgi:hypothetical protein